jgi:hypothetical protein
MRPDHAWSDLRNAPRRNLSPRYVIMAYLLVCLPVAAAQTRTLSTDPQGPRKAGSQPGIEIYLTQPGARLVLQVIDLEPQIKSARLAENVESEDIAIGPDGRLYFNKLFEPDNTQQYTNVRLSERSRTEEMLSTEIRNWVPDIARAIDRAPAFDPKWIKLAVAQFLTQFDGPGPTQMVPPSLAWVWVPSSLSILIRAASAAQWR